MAPIRQAAAPVALALLICFTLQIIQSHASTGARSLLQKGKGGDSTCITCDKFTNSADKVFTSAKGGCMRVMCSGRTATTQVGQALALLLHPLRQFEIARETLHTCTIVHHVAHSAHFNMHSNAHSRGVAAFVEPSAFGQPLPMLLLLLRPAALCHLPCSR